MTRHICNPFDLMRRNENSNLVNQIALLIRHALKYIVVTGGNPGYVIHFRLFYWGGRITR